MPIVTKRGLAGPTNIRQIILNKNNVIRGKEDIAYMYIKLSIHQEFIENSKIN